MLCFFPPIAWLYFFSRILLSFYLTFTWLMHFCLDVHYISAILCAECFFCCRVFFSSRRRSQLPPKRALCSCSFIVCARSGRDCWPPLTFSAVASHPIPNASLTLGRPLIHLVRVHCVCACARARVPNFVSESLIRLLWRDVLARSCNWQNMYALSRIFCSLALQRRAFFFHRMVMFSVHLTGRTFPATF